MKSFFFTLWFYVWFVSSWLFLAMPYQIPLYLLTWVFPSTLPFADKTFGLWGWIFRKGLWGLQIERLQSPKARALPSQGARFYVANHRSHLDGFLAKMFIPEARMIAKKSLFAVPFMGLIMILTHHIGVSKANPKSLIKARDRLARILRSGRWTWVFPELTRVKDPQVTLLEFSLIPFSAVAGSGAPVIPVVIKGTDQVWRPGSWGLRWGGRVQFVELDPLWATPEKSAEDLRRESFEAIRKEWTEKPLC
jgi:1-acyl-sn-glycerol-3-phosphate acyltransferase